MEIPLFFFNLSLKMIFTTCKPGLGDWQTLQILQAPEEPCVVVLPLVLMLLLLLLLIVMMMLREASAPHYT